MCVDIELIVIITAKVKIFTVNYFCNLLSPSGLVKILSSENFSFMVSIVEVVVIMHIIVCKVRAKFL